jgi:beta-carotene 15,15'-dioxygenase
MRVQAVPKWLKALLLVAVATAFYALEQQWSASGLWLLIVLSLTVGMGHGALDVVLLLGQFRPPSTAMIVAALYLVLVLFSAWLLSLSFTWALVALLLMSVWHFGEGYGQFTLRRIAVGGASLMAPALLQGAALRELIQSMTTLDVAWALNAWTAMAWVWAAFVLLLVIACCADGKENAKSSQHLALSTSRALLEIGIVICLNLLFSPALQFALYFGLFHCTLHIARVRRATLRHQVLPNQFLAGAWVVVMVLTAALLAALWQWLPSTLTLAGDLTAKMLHWLVLALGAVTVPHLILVSYSSRWLGR